ncbi:MAG: hypothetical protein OEV60_06205 [Actinomycetota bacterium]|nr:hypothetical protein [Actinomycetota bacterium]MDH5314546.1 hypothetical protein [Actinomycetota bacterium]
MTTREDLEALPTKELYDRAIDTAKHRFDVGFYWDLLKALPVAEEVIGDDERSKTDIRRPLALLNDLLYDADSGPLGEALRPMYVDYLLEHGAAPESDARGSDAAGAGDDA